MGWSRLEAADTETFTLVVALALVVGTAVVSPERYGDGLDWTWSIAPRDVAMPAPRAEAELPAVDTPASGSGTRDAWGRDPWLGAPTPEARPEATWSSDPWARRRAERLHPTD